MSMYAKGVPVLSRDGKEVGVIATGKMFPCSMGSCRGQRIAVRWANKAITFPCFKGLDAVEGGWKISGGVEADPLMTLKARLHPSTLRTSPRMSAVLAFALGESWTNPTIDSMTITSDGIVLTQQGNCVFSSFAELEDNYNGALRTVDATDAERAAFWSAFFAKASDWRSGGNAYSR